VKKSFFIFPLLSVLLLNELSVHAQEIQYEANPQEIKWDGPKEDENLPNYDGNKWKALSFEQKCSFYYGYELGRIMTIERIDDLKKLLQNGIDKTVSQEIQEEFMKLHDSLDIFFELLEKYETVVAQDKMVSLVDRFYDNPANLKIHMYHAFVINKLIKNGESAKVIENLIDFYKRKDKKTRNSFFLSPWLPLPEFSAAQSAKYPARWVIL
jgi:hypothetical protein